MEEDDQIMGFHFLVEFAGLKIAGNTDLRFQSVEGLEVESEKEFYREGGENRFVHILPGRKSYSPLILKRGILTPGDSVVTNWLQRSFANLKKEPVNIRITLLNEKHEPLLSWKLFHVWPLSWKIAKLDAHKAEVLIETLELNYNRFELSS